MNHDVPQRLQPVAAPRPKVTRIDLARSFEKSVDRNQIIRLNEMLDAEAVKREGAEREAARLRQEAARARLDAHIESTLRQIAEERWLDTGKKLHATLAELKDVTEQRDGWTRLAVTAAQSAHDEATALRADRDYHRWRAARATHELAVIRKAEPGLVPTFARGGIVPGRRALLFEPGETFLPPGDPANG